MNQDIYVLAGVSFTAGLGYGILPTIFYSVAEEKGLSEFVIGIIISTYSIANLSITPFSKRFFEFFGKQKCLVISLITEVFLFL